MNQSKPSVNGKRVYFATPMFAAMEKEYGLKIAHLLESYGYQVFVPYRDGYEAAAFEGKSEEELVAMIFAKDLEEVKKADILFMNLDGRAPDEGGCVELGMAFMLGKRCYGFKTDTRSVEMGLDLNPMITGCMKMIFKDFDGDTALRQVEDYIKAHDL